MVTQPQPGSTEEHLSSGEAVDMNCNLSSQAVMERLDTSLSGLAPEEVEQRRQRFGPNSLESKPPVSAWRILLNQFTSFIIYLLLFAVLFSVLIGEYIDSLVILAILILNGLIGFFQELKANRSLEALKKLASIQTVVVRDGREQELPADQLVPGDIINLDSGDKVPADARLVKALQLQVDESVLTGESTAVSKDPPPLTGHLQVSDQINMVFASTVIVGGRGVAVVTATGMQTEIGRISQLLTETEEERTPLQHRLDRFGKNLGLVIIAICCLVFLLSLARYGLRNGTIPARVFLDFSFIAISLAVAAVPTALPAVVTIALSVGTKRLLAKNTLVRQLTSVETLGCCDVICADKTGTLTQNKMTVTEVWTPDAGSADPASPDTGAITPLLFQIGAACNNATISSQEGTIIVKGTPTEGALLVSARRAGIPFTGKRLDELPFDPQRKCMSVKVEMDNRLYQFTKGAPDHLLVRCSSFLFQGQGRSLTEEDRKRIIDKNNLLASQAKRVIAFSYRTLGSSQPMEENNLVFVGLQAMIDPPRPTVTSSIERASKAFIRTVMITGDHRETAVAIGDAIGISGSVLTGEEVDKLDDLQLKDKLEKTSIFARVVPEHKQRIVAALQQLGHTVAMTGDGVNDAPALKKADIGIAVGSGTEVAKEAADFVLLDDAFDSIVDAVEEGRGIYDNIQKSIMLLLSGNLMEVLVIFLAVLLGFNLPLTALLLLWINLVTDGAPALAYTVDPYSKDIMNRPPIPVKEGILPGHRLRLLLLLGVVGTLIGLVVFVTNGGNEQDQESIQRARTMLFSYIVLYEMLLAFVIRSSYRVRLFSNSWLWLAVLLSLLLQAAILYTPINVIFHVTPLSGYELSLLFLAGLAFAVVCLIAGWAGKKAYL